jgi:competence protein ComK
MEIRKHYLIIDETVLLKGIYYKNGEKYTEVIEANDRFLVSQSPTEIIEFSLIRYGLDFKGALKSSKHLLGNKVKMHPIMVNPALDIWIFPSHSYKKQDCVWFVLKHIQDTEPLGLKHTKIYLNYDHTFELKMRRSSFIIKRDKANELRDKITNTANNHLSFLAEQRKGFYLREDKGEYVLQKDE